MEERGCQHSRCGRGVAWPRRSRMCKLCLLQEEETQAVLSSHHLSPLLQLFVSSSDLQLVQFLSFP